MSILSALAFGAIVLGAYYLIGSSKKDTSAASADGGPTLESPPTAASAATAKNPLFKQVEIVGLRLTQNKAKKTEVHFLVVNHSGGEIQDFSGTINLMARTGKKGDEPVGSFSFKAPSIGAYESKEMTALVDTKLKVYELPDWQNLQPQLSLEPQ
jgi:hypothetical protein